MNRRGSTRRTNDQGDPQAAGYEAVAVPGLEDFATDEIQLLGARVRRTSREGRLAVHYEGTFERFSRLRSVLAVYAVQQIDAARPSALLGHENFTALARLAGAIVNRAPDAFETLRISAAGSDSAVLRRLRSDLASTLDLRATSEAANLELALRRKNGYGWELLVRLTPMPLSARAWRVCNYPGALNATVAYAMVELTNPTPSDVFVNACCGSGTFLAERLAIMPARSAIGFDINSEALACARENLRFLPDVPVELSVADAGALPLADSSAAAVVADPPFAMLQGTSEANRSLYAAIFREAARVLRSDGVFAIVSTQKRLLGEVIATQADNWSPLPTLEVKLPFERGYITPVIHVLRRR